MTKELTDREARELAGALRPNRKPLFYAVAVNLIIAGLVLGVPYLRGQRLAREERALFVELVQCMLGGEPAPTPGLAIPRGEREHYAAKYLFAEPEWPLSCRPTLAKMQPPDAIFLWPSVKLAGQDLHATLEIVDRDLQQLALKRTQMPDRVPAKPLDTLKRLQAATVLYARAADVAGGIDNDSLVLPPQAHGLVAPSRLPLMVGESLALEAWSDAGTLEALTIDTHSLAYLRVENGKVDRQRLRRTGFLRGFVRAGNDPFLVWAMPEERCAEREDRCVGRPTGLARFDKGSTTLGEPTWKVFGHPAGRLDRVLAISNTGRIDLLTKSDAVGGLELLRTRLPNAGPGAPTPTEPQRLEPEVKWTIATAAAVSGGKTGVTQPSPTPAQGTTDAGTTAAADGVGVNGGTVTEVVTPPAVSAVLVPGEPLAVLYAADAADGTVHAGLSWTGEPSKQLPLPGAAGRGGWAVSCTSADRWLAYGSTSELHIATLQAAPSPQLLASQPADLFEPLDERDRSRDRVQLVCSDRGARLVYVDRAQVLWQITCAADSCQAPREVLRGVARFSAVQRHELTLLAFQAGLTQPTIKVLRLDEQGTPLGEPAIAASCWEPLGGLCGTPTLINATERAVLLGRDGPDLLALETSNEGRSYTSLSGFAVGRSFEQSTTSPLEQHRKRKGMEKP